MAITPEHKKSMLEGLGGTLENLSMSNKLPIDVTDLVAGTVSVMTLETVNRMLSMCTMGLYLEKVADGGKESFILKKKTR